MGFYSSNSTNSVAPLQNSFSAKDSASGRNKHCSKEDEDDDGDIKIKSLLQKMIWDLGLACFNPPSHEKGCSWEKSVEKYKDKAWLLAESGGSGRELNAAEPHSVHSSFRLSVCSQFELETIKAKNFPSATVLMVNFENGMTDSQPGELKWKRIESLERSIYPLAHSLIRFTFPEIVSASRNFSADRVLGRGALSYVFRGRVGILRTAVAIKRLCKEDAESPKAFYRELMIAGSLHNPHIVPLVGFCIDPDQGFFLVYKYVSGGSLDRYLHEKKSGKKGGSTLPWSVRYKIAVQIAKAIGYLHNGTERCIVHRDIKPSNILLSSKKSAKLCDFGLAAWTPAPSVPFLCKTVKGTFGYLAPEYFQHGKVSDKADVYAFGVVLLELITGRRPIEAKRGPGEENLVVWAKPLLEQGCIEKLLDPQLKLNKKNYNRVAQMVEATNACIHSEESRRPNAEEITALLRRGGPNGLTRWKASLSRNSSVNDLHPQCQPTKTEMKNHKALAMLGTLEFEDNEHIYGR